MTSRSEVVVVVIVVTVGETKPDLVLALSKS